MHHHLAGLANALFFFLLASVRCIRFVAGQNGPYDPCRFVGHRSRLIIRFILKNQTHCAGSNFC
jgi:hypothetical protein